MRRARAACCLLLAAAVPRLDAQTPSDSAARAGAAVRAVRTSAALRLDGVPDEPAWHEADSVTAFTQREPDEGAPAPERTVVRFLATDAGLWVGFWASETHAGGVRRAQLRRDADLNSDDRVGIVLDPLRDHRTGYVFIVNPNGALYDAELRGSEHENADWNGVWDARAHVSADGWTAELFIPWQTLRYQPGSVAWGLNAGRFIRHTNTEVLWRGWHRQQGFTYLLDEGELVGMGALPPRALLELRPYGLARADLATRDFFAAGSDSLHPARTDSLSAPAGASATAGLDAKMAVAPTLTLDLTANTDFAQVEADNQVVNLSRFPLFFPEKRPFFLESAGIFDFGQSERTLLFYSRRIGLDPATGLPVPIIAGARLTGRAGADRLGVLALRTGGAEDAVDLVARVKHDVSARGYLGAMVTGEGGPGQDGVRRSGGIDFELPLLLGGQNIVPSGYVAWTGGAGGRPAMAWRAFLDYPNDWADDFLAVNYVDAGFDPSLGFVVQRGYWRHTGQFAVRPRPHRLGIRQLDFKLIEWDVTTNLDGSPSHAFYEVRPFGATFESGDVVEFNLQHESDAPPDSFELFPGRMVAPGRYAWNRYEARVGTTPARALAVEVEWSGGGFYGGDAQSLEYAVSAHAAPHVVASVEGSEAWVRIAAGRFRVHESRLRFDYAASPRLATTAFLQWDNASDRLAINARLHWIPSPGSDAYLVWNTAWPAGIPGGIPWRRPLRGALIAKMVRYFRW